jgi:hypothetical protein
VARHRVSVRLRLTNLASRALHPLGAKGWGYANYVKVGFEAAAFPRVLKEGRWSDARPDLDQGLAAVRWAPLDLLVPADLRPGTSVEVMVPFPPAEARGHVELVVLARRGEQWLTYRQTVGPRYLVPGDLRDGVLRALLGVAMAALAFVGQRRRMRSAAESTRSVARRSWGDMPPGCCSGSTSPPITETTKG